MGRVKCIAYYQGASVGDEHVFFTDDQRLTEDSTGSGAGAGAAFDLYEAGYDPSGGAVTVTDMTVPVNAGEAADVLGVAGVSEDGSVVYAIAKGVLTPKAEENGNEEHAVSGRPNLYRLERSGGAWRPTFITTLSSTDEKDWGGYEIQGRGSGESDHARVCERPLAGVHVRSLADRV